MSESDNTLRGWLRQEITAILRRKVTPPPLVLWCDPEGAWCDLLKAAADGGAFDVWADGRKWYVSSHCTETEVVVTALAAYERAVLHELREKFRYKGVVVANPHLSVEALAEAVGDPANLDSRPDDN